VLYADYGIFITEKLKFFLKKEEKVEKRSEEKEWEERDEENEEREIGTISPAR
jgi:hypothetical protein